MKTVVTQTKFFGTAAEGTAILTGSELPGIMAKVTEFCVSHEIVGRSPSIAFGAESSGDLTFDPSYIELSTKGK
jgi:hypothetical protein